MDGGRHRERGNPDLANMTRLLKESVLRYLPEPGDYPLTTPNVTLHRRDETNVPEDCFYRPIVGLTLQGAKRTTVGHKTFSYGANNCIVTGVDMPSTNVITEASAENPYLVVSIYLDAKIIADFLAEMPPGPGDETPGNSVVAPTDPEILTLFLRLVALEDTPDHIPFVSPLIVREIHFRLLVGPQGGLLRALFNRGGRGNRIAEAIHRIRSGFREPLDVDRLAQTAHLSPQAFRRHFKDVTTMSPTAYHKRLRLYEAQRLMLEGDVDAASAAYAVGYESPNQFSRDYKRLFGDPPRRSVKALLQGAAGTLEHRP